MSDGRFDFVSPKNMDTTSSSLASTDFSNDDTNIQARWELEKQHADQVAKQTAAAQQQSGK